MNAKEKFGTIQLHDCLIEICFVDEDNMENQMKDKRKCKKED